MYLHIFFIVIVFHPGQIQCDSNRAGTSPKTSDVATEGIPGEDQVRPAEDQRKGGESPNLQGGPQQHTEKTSSETQVCKNREQGQHGVESPMRDFRDLEPRNLPIKDFYLVQKCRLSYFGALQQKKFGQVWQVDETSCIRTMTC